MRWTSAIWQRNSLRAALDLAVVSASSEYATACANLPGLVSELLSVQP